MSIGERRVRLPHPGTPPCSSWPSLMTITLSLQVQCQELFHGHWSHLILPRVLLGRYSHHCFSYEETEVQRGSATCQRHRASVKQGFESWHQRLCFYKSLRLGCSPDLNLGLASFAKHTLTAGLL